MFHLMITQFIYGQPTRDSCAHRKDFVLNLAFDLLTRGART